MRYYYHHDTHHQVRIYLCVSCMQSSVPPWQIQVYVLTMVNNTLLNAMMASLCGKLRMWGWRMACTFNDQCIPMSISEVHAVLAWLVSVVHDGGVWKCGFVIWSVMCYVNSIFGILPWWVFFYMLLLIKRGPTMISRKCKLSSYP